MSGPFHRMLFSTVLLAGLAQAAPYPNTANFGVPFSQDESWYRQCMRVEGRSAPSLGSQAPAQRCNAGDLYYDMRSQAAASAAQWRQVRACALAQEDDAVLMMLYANGFGVQQDADIAIHHACKLEFIAKAEMESRIARLSSPRPAGAVFDQCDDITSGHMGAVCAGIRAGQAERIRKARLDRHAAALAPSARRALIQLRAAADRYAAAAETNMEGTAAPGRAIARQAKLQEQFAQTLVKVLDNGLPAASSRDLARVDKELNAVYRSLMSPAPSEAGRPERVGGSTITRTDVRQAERRWIAYRDAFLAFRARLPSGASREAIAVELTGQRLGELNTIMRYR
ncbi:MAG: DUF1311 domain-containing protein [Lysobacteraceae bacterium]|nr:MAG: DUF1311 domain-containing protein [Xanthomonadaceae bacterium]